MNWPLLLAGYPRSILQDSLPVTILALLERSGLITEDQLVAMTGADERKTKEALFDLRLNSLIEYGSHHLRLTERGKRLIDRFDLAQEIMSNVLDTLDLRDKERESYRRALDAYRETAYIPYLNSLSSLWTWESLAHWIPKSATPSILGEISAGKTVLLVSDIDSWWRRQQAAIHTAPDLFSQEVRLSCEIVSSQLSTWTAAHHGESDLHSRYARALWEPSKALVGHLHDREHEARSAHLLVFTAFGRFRASSELDRWFDQWVELHGHLPEPGRSKRVKFYTDILRELLADRTMPDDGSTFFSLVEPKLLPARSGISGTGSFLYNLLVAESIHDLAKSLGVPEEEANVLLEDIVEKCRLLLKSEGVLEGERQKTGEGEGPPNPALHRTPTAPSRGRRR